MSSPSARRSSQPTATPARPERFPRSKRLRKRAEFQRVYVEGRKLASAYFRVFFRRTGDQQPPRAGISVSRSVGNAVGRNRVKRRLREALRRNWAEIPDGCEIVIHAHPRAIDAPWKDLEAEIRRVSREVGRSVRPHKRRDE